MKNTIFIALYAVLMACGACLVVLGIDMHVAREDYLRAEKNGDYEQAITGCMFDWVCEKYTKELQK